LVERVPQQRPGVLHVPAMERIESLVDQGFGLALLFGLGATRALDVGPGTVVMAVQEQDTGPHVDGGLEVAGEVVIETGDQQLFDARVLPRRARTAGWRWMGRLRIGHNLSAAQYST
jgi:hypothetical protein